MDYEESDSSKHSDVEEVPLNEEIEKSQGSQLEVTQEPPVENFDKLPPGAPIEALNPKNYAFVPSAWTGRIRAAGSA